MSYSNIDGSGGQTSISLPRGDADETASSISFASSRKPKSIAALSEPLCANSDQSEDPYYVFREDLIQKMIQVDEGLAEYLRIVHQTDTAVNTQELKEARKVLKRNIKGAESTLKDIQMTVQMLESDRSKFSHISEAEIYDRQAMIQTNKDRIQRSKHDMQSESVKAKMLADERAKALRRAGALGANTDNQRENTNLIVDSQARTSLLVQHQDETLDELGEAVVRVGDMAGNINEEIGQQNKMLSEMEEDLDRVEEELGMVMGKLAKFLHTKNKWQLTTILIMSGIVIVLFFLVLYS